MTEKNKLKKYVYQNLKKNKSIQKKKKKKKDRKYLTRYKSKVT